MLYELKSLFRAFALLSVLIVSFLLILPISNLAASDQKINLSCTYSHTLDFKTGRTSGTSGEALATIEHNEMDIAVITLRSMSTSVYVGTISEEEIIGELNFELNNDDGSKRHVTQTLKINRYTGKFTEMLSIKNEDGGLIHYGDCVSAQKKF